MTYSELVSERKSCRACDGLTNPAQCEGGIYDCDQVGPWTAWHGNRSPALMVVGQDWGDTNYFVQRQGREDPRNATNVALAELVCGLGVSMESVFLTNAILCLKQGGCQAAVKREWFRNCAERFLKPTIEEIKPRVLVALGQHAYKSVQSVYGLALVRFRDAVNRVEPFVLPNGTRFFAVYHCGRRILNTHRKLEIQRADWSRIRRVL